MRAQFLPASLGGEIRAVPSKSEAHRALICAALADGISEIEGLFFSDDVMATIGAVTALGASVSRNGSSVAVKGIGTGTERREAVIDCGESGSTLRFLLPVAGALGTDTVFKGKGRLPERPIGPYRIILPEKGICFGPEEKMPFRISGRLESGIYTVPGDISSQFVSGLLFALPILSGESRIRITGTLESRPYVEMTLRMLSRFGIEIRTEGSDIIVPGDQRYLPCSVGIEGDFSQAAFFLTAGACSSPVTVSGLDCSGTLQGDRKIIDYLKSAGAGVAVDAGSVTVTPPKTALSAFDADARDIPDLVPILAVLASLCVGQSKIFNARRLRIKESDRLETTASLVRAFGAKADVTEDGLLIEGAPALSGAHCDSFGDHRIAMAFAIAASAASGESVLENAEAVRKSYPSFYDDYKQLGGNVNVFDL